MIESFTITNHLGEKLVLELACPEKSGLLVDSVTGLGQVKAEVNTTKLAGSDYSIKNSALLIERNVVFNLLYYGDDSERSEHLADRIFSTKKNVKIDVKTTERELTFSGTVEKNEPNIFSKESGCQISIICTDPFMYEVDDTTTIFDSLEPSFEFPFHSDLPDYGDDMVEFGNIRIVQDKSIYYTGEAETGITIYVHSLGVVRDLTFYDLKNRKKISIDDNILESILGNSIMYGDDIVISSIKGNKYATLTRNGVTYNIINAIAKDKTIDWFEISSGDNLMTYSASEGLYDLLIRTRHRVSYKGI